MYSQNVCSISSLAYICLLRHGFIYCTVLYCSVLYCTVLYCTVLYCTVSRTVFVLLTGGNVSTIDVLENNVTRTLLFVPNIRYVLYCTVLYCTVLYCTVLYWIVLYCTVLEGTGAYGPLLLPLPEAFRGPLGT